MTRTLAGRFNWPRIWGLLLALVFGTACWTLFLWGVAHLVAGVMQ